MTAITPVPVFAHLLSVEPSGDAGWLWAEPGLSYANAALGNAYARAASTLAVLSTLQNAQRFATVPE